jgi:hypothetical protein
MRFALNGRATWNFLGLGPDALRPVCRPRQPGRRRTGDAEGLKDLHLSNIALGIAFSAFNSYVPFQLVRGWFADRFAGSWTTPFAFSVGVLLFAIVMTQLDPAGPPDRGRCPHQRFGRG